MSFRILEHTADIGFEASAPNLPALFAEAARALTFIALDPSPNPPPDQTHSFTCRAESIEDLLVNFLNEILFLIDARSFAPTSSVISISATSLQATIHGHPRLPEQAKLVVKGVTWHQLEITQHPSGFHCQVFLDI